MRLSLTRHPDTPARAVSAIEVEIAATDRRAVRIGYTVHGAAGLLVPAPARPRRADGLWRTTCFELFVRPESGEGYCEFNFSPSTEWAAYRFDGYRAGMADLPLAAPEIEPTEDGVRVTVDLAGLPSGAGRAALTAVIEERDGTKSWWALKHPVGAPDFHDPACFTLELPAAR